MNKAHLAGEAGGLHKFSLSNRNMFEDSSRNYSPMPTPQVEKDITD